MENAMHWSLTRIAALAVACAGTLFWLYTFYAIAQLPVGDGSGFQWVAVMPLGAVYFALTFPALMFAAKGDKVPLALGLGCAGLVGFALLWAQLLTEFNS
jgi:hypothetical protein